MARILKLLKYISDNKSDLLNNPNAQYLKEQTILDEKEEILKTTKNKPKDIPKTPKNELDEVMLKIYQIRNNLTHGNKSGNERDKQLVIHANEVLENLIDTFSKKLKSHKYYFAYGSNMNEKQLQERCLNPNLYTLGKSCLKNYRLDFTTKSGFWKGGVADVVYNEGSVVWGLLYVLNKEEIKLLDHYEGFPTYYTRDEEDLSFDDQTIKAWVYKVANKDSFIPPSEKYINTIIEAAIKYDFPEDYINYLKSIETI